MENGGHVYGCYSNRSKPQLTADTTNTNYSNANNPVWDLWGPLINTTSNHTSLISVYPAAEESAAGNYEQLTLYNGRRSGLNLQSDSHLMCLKLGKRHYFAENFPVSGTAEFSVGKKVKLGGGCGQVWRTLPAAAVVPRCQVEGCHVALGNAKDYHRRHKVCEMHSKAPKVIVLGLEQRFCQQCSRFHVVSEFDESKRSCRRRLAGHNERRRKGNHDFVAGNTYHDKLTISSSETSNALSLLSRNTNSWNISSPDLSSRSSAALRELIEEHRATILSKHLQHSSIQELPSYDDHHHHLQTPTSDDFKTTTCNSFFSNRFQDDGAVTTLDLMQKTQSASSAFGFLSSSRDNKVKENRDDDDECSVFWNSWNGVGED